jgi:multicomponent Na+:H+ antiporter subunit B
MDAEILNLVLWAAIIVAALLVAFSKNNLLSVIYLTVFSLITAALFLSMEAPDVAITEASIGAAISTLFLLAAVNIVGKSSEGRAKRRKLTFALMLVLFAAFISIIRDLPEYGSSTSPVNQGVGKHYLDNTKGDIGIPATVTATLASYRGYDTLGETYVILCAGLAIVLILPIIKKKKI